ncbi:MAG TPA: heavy-metal-associated domain-containing protein [Candidatus Hydrothermia bacterium]|nr:heavy-metal-associated domain-containing protein [Candidatus Hydrothermae bacterium]MDD3649191.1 heavy-metal-associated domain-containing protein [Candidatus Hydrothermia bacterium]MDD5572450.1 heavy-metal-associated domain-containing protein [Candidatus Hydrothermia bacterium]HOK23387.1 heavy-metal-associated domain-containing protein [Candidatus Hydrothermia bacterium]HOL24197.1 heavy-metal-associated domain-containing protein [Candidatus Hydrothermia bacterium]
MAKYKIEIPDMHCNHCKMKIDAALREAGERDFEINVEHKVLIIETDNLDTVLGKLENIGYPARKVEE